MTTAITTTNPQQLALRDLTLKQVKLQLSKIDSDIARATTFSAYENIKDRAKLLNAYFNSREGIKKLGEHVASLRQQLAEEEVFADRMLSELARKIPERPKRIQEYKNVGVAPAKALEIDRAGTLPRKQVDVYLKVKRSEGLPPKTQELARLARLDEPQRRQVLTATIGDRVTPPVTIAKAFKQVESVPVKPTTEDLKVAANAKLASKARDLTPALVRVVKLAQSVTGSALLVEVKAFDYLWSEFKKNLTSLGS